VEEKGKGGEKGECRILDVVRTKDNLPRGESLETALQFLPGGQSSEKRGERGKGHVELLFRGSPPNVEKSQSSGDDEVREESLRYALQGEVGEGPPEKTRR